jgi:hypothetical protein
MPRSNEDLPDILVFPTVKSDGIEMNFSRRAASM